MSQTTTATQERPIIFTGESVRAILAGRKVQTRRVVKPQPAGETWALDPYVLGEWNNRPMPYSVGSRLWVKERFYVDHVDYDRNQKLPTDPAAAFGLGLNDMLFYPADAPHEGQPWCCQLIPECSCYDVGKPKARSPLYMPRWASRLMLEITGVRVERVQDISEAHAQAEGCECRSDLAWDGAVGSADPYKAAVAHGHRAHFRSLWDALNAARGFPWASNCWVWVIEFQRVTP